MKIILLKGQQGTAKTSIWGPAIAQFFERRGQKVSYLSDGEATQREFDRAVASGSDVIIVETHLGSFPFKRAAPDFTVTVENGD